MSIGNFLNNNDGFERLSLSTLNRHIPRKNDILEVIKCRFFFVFLFFVLIGIQSMQG